MRPARCVACAHDDEVRLGVRRVGEERVAREELRGRDDVDELGVPVAVEWLAAPSCTARSRTGAPRPGCARRTGRSRRTRRAALRQAAVPRRRRRVVREDVPSTAPTAPGDDFLDPPSDVSTTPASPSSPHHVPSRSPPVHGSRAVADGDVLAAERAARAGASARRCRARCVQRQGTSRSVEPPMTATGCVGDWIGAPRQLGVLRELEVLPLVDRVRGRRPGGEPGAAVLARLDVGRRALMVTCVSSCCAMMSSVGPSPRSVGARAATSGRGRRWPRGSSSSQTLVGKRSVAPGHARAAAAVREHLVGDDRHVRS